MIKRVLSGAVLVILGASLFILPFWARYLVVVILMLIAHREMIQALRAADYHPLEWMGYVFSIALFPVYIIAGSTAVWILLIVIMMIGFIQRIFSKKLSSKDVFIGFIPILYPLVFFIFIAFTAVLDDMLWITVLLSGLAAACVTDVFALFAGMLFGKHPLAPNISPKKTIEGAIGGFVFSSLAGIAIFACQFFWGAEFPLWRYLISAMIGSCAGQLGDLTASSIKRETGIKDFGKIIPGHGGVLDRLDSILFTIPVAYIIFIVIP